MLQLAAHYMCKRRTCCMLPWKAATRPSIVRFSCRGVTIGMPSPPLDGGIPALQTLAGGIYNINGGLEGVLS